MQKAQPGNMANVQIVNSSVLCVWQNLVRRPSDTLAAPFNLIGWPLHLFDQNIGRRSDTKCQMQSTSVVNCSFKKKKKLGRPMKFGFQLILKRNKTMASYKIWLSTHTILKWIHPGACSFRKCAYPDNINTHQFHCYWNWKYSIENMRILANLMKATQFHCNFVSMNRTTGIHLKYC